MTNGIRLNHWFFWVLAVMVVFNVAVASAQTYPRYSATVTSTGFVPLYSTSPTDATRLSLIQVTATTDLNISFWTYYGSAWHKSAPLFGATAGDTTLSIASGASEAYLFKNGPWPKAIYVSSGTCVVKGE